MFELKLADFNSVVFVVDSQKHSMGGAPYTFVKGVGVLHLSVSAFTCDPCALATVACTDSAHMVPLFMQGRSPAIQGQLLSH